MDKTSVRNATRGNLQKKQVLLNALHARKDITKGAKVKDRASLAFLVNTTTNQG
jgi:hypothetical protein